MKRRDAMGRCVGTLVGVVLAGVAGLCAGCAGSGTAGEASARATEAPWTELRCRRSGTSAWLGVRAVGEAYLFEPHGSAWSVNERREMMGRPTWMANAGGSGPGYVFEYLAPGRRSVVVVTSDAEAVKVLQRSLGGAPLGQYDVAFPKGLWFAEWFVPTGGGAVFEP